MNGQQPASCSVEELRGLFLFEHLDQEQLEWLCAVGRVEEFPAGPVHRQGEPATSFRVLLEGTVVLSLRVGPDDVEFNQTSDRGVYAGAFQAYLGDRVPQLYTNSLRVTVPSRFFVLAAEDFARCMREWFPMAVHLLEGLFFGTRLSQQATGQRARLLALGTLSASLTHELNNPAAAAVRSVSALREQFEGMRGALAALAAAPQHSTALDSLVELQARAAEHTARAAAHGETAPSGDGAGALPGRAVLGPLEAADREDEVGDWLEERGVADGWSLAPVLVQTGLDTDWLDRAAGELDGAALPQALRWLGHSIEAGLLLDEIEAATSRVSALVGAARQYSQLDRASYQQVDVHDLLDSTLVILGGKIGPGVRVVRHYDRGLPRIPGYAAELNQVWTNLIDNALYAMAGQGELTVTTRLEPGRLLVEFRDTGPGVPEEIRARIFEPFFTNKPVGDGTGLGLDISWRIVVQRHHGDLTVESVPGDTRFRVSLPLTAHAPATPGATNDPDPGSDAPTDREPVPGTDRQETT